VKKTVEIIIENKTYELCYDIKKLSRFERLIGKSIVFMFSVGSAGLVQQADIKFTVSGLVVALDLKNEDEAYDLIEKYCETIGDLDHLNAKIIEAVLATGLFTPGIAKEQEEAVPKKTQKK